MAGKLWPRDAPVLYPGRVTPRLRGGLTGVPRAPLQSHHLVLNVRVAIFEYICLLKSGDFGNFRKLENFEWEEIKIFILEVTNYNSRYFIVDICNRIYEIRFILVFFSINEKK